MPWMTPGWHYSIDTGHANYNALLVQFQKRFSNSLNMIASYTWSKSLDNSSGWFNAENGTGGGSVVQNFFNPHNAYGVSSYDIRNYFTWSTVYALPFGRGQHWVQTGILSYIVGGWTANYLFQARSGQPYNLNVGGDVANISGDNGSVTELFASERDRPAEFRNLRFDADRQARPNGFCEYNSSAFAIPSGSFGNMGKMPFRQPYYNNLDFSLVKLTPLYERSIWNCVPNLSTLQRDDHGEPRVNGRELICGSCNRHRKYSA